MNITKSLTYIFIVSIISLFSSCSKDDKDITAAVVVNPQLAATLTNDNHKIELFTANGKFQTGYNAINFQIKNNDGSLVNNATATWFPKMNMMTMSHSCPFSPITKSDSLSTKYEGFIVFQMASNESEGWELTLNYTINGTAYVATGKIDVAEASKRVVQSFKANDSLRYVLAMIEPKTPISGVNEMSAVLYKMENMMSFVPVENYKIKIDPRMPGMGNHSSPNNIDLTHSTSGKYLGKVNFTMTGYWKINLQLVDTSDTVIKGEAVSANTESSSIYFEIEF